MKYSFAVVADPLEKVRGGIENHASILFQLLSGHNVNVTFIDYRELTVGNLSKFDVVIIEGLHRIKLLKVLFAKTNNILILFTHGSFYLSSPDRKDLRRYVNDKYFTSKILFDKIFTKKILKKFDGIITLSKKESLDVSKLFKIPMDKFSELEVFSDEPGTASLTSECTEKYADSIYICYVGRLEKRKNLQDLLISAHRLDMQLIIAGQDQGILKSLKNYSMSNHFDKFKYLGIISKEEKLALLSCSKLIVIPSYFEGMPLLAIEGIKLGKNIVMTSNSYMQDHPCVTLAEPNADSLINAIGKALNERGCSTGFISNEGIFQKFMDIIVQIAHRR